jgi:putative ABC transport system permease protein
MPEWKPEIFRRLAPLNLAPRREAEIADELSQHLEDRYQELLASGQSEDAAFRVALDELKGEDVLARGLSGIERNFYREPIVPGKASGNIFEGIVQDVRYAVRMLMKSRGFTAIAVLMLALGIGVNTAIFSLVDAALFKPLYAANPGQLVSIFWGDTEGNGLSNHSYAYYLDYRRESASVVSGLAAFTTMPGTLLLGQTTERINIGLVSDNYFSVLGVSTVAGRGFLPEENQAAGASFVAVIGESLWRKQYGSSADLRGKTVLLNNSRYSVVGVVPERACRMAGVVKIDVFVSAVMEGVIGGDKDFFSKRDNKEFMVIGRLRNGVTVSRAQAQFAVIAAELREQYPASWSEDGRPHPLSVVPATTVPFELRGMVTGFAGLLLAAAIVVLLVMCANLGGVLLARLLPRRKEIAVRVALGANRRRLVQQVLSENLLLALLGGTAGFLIAVWEKKLLTAFAPNIGVPLIIDLNVDYRVLGFSTLLTLLTALALGLAPALQATRVDVQSGLKGGEQAQTGAVGRSRLRNALIIGQVALSLVLLMCAGIFFGSFGKLNSVDLGFDPNNLALLSADLGADENSGGQAREFISQSITRLRSVPGAESVAVAAEVPMGLSRVSEQVVPDAQPQPPTWISSNMVGPHYFQVMRIPLLRGRPFTEQDTDHGSVTIVNDTLSKLFWPHEEALGKQIREPSGKTYEVVGVVKTGKYHSLDENPLPYAYFPLNPRSARVSTFLVRTRIPAERTLGLLRDKVSAVNPAIPVFDVETMNEHLADSILPVRMGLIVLGSFGCLALALASIGLYGLLSYMVRQRTREIGIRMALGASPRQVLKTVMGHGVRLTILGVAIGSVIGFAISIMIGSQLYGISSVDIAALAGVVLLQIGVALVACYVPARRSMRVDPMIALRYE